MEPPWLQPVAKSDGASREASPYRVLTFRAAIPSSSAAAAWRSDNSGMDWPKPLTVGEVAAELRCSEDEVRSLIRDGELQTVACGIRPSLVPRHQFDPYLRRLRHRLKASAGPSTAA